MIDILLQTSNIPYSIALTIVLFVIALDVILMVVGVGVMGAMDALHIDTEVNLQLSGFNQLANWACLNKVPFVVWLLLVLTGFGLTGLTLNFLSYKIMGFLPTVILTLPLAVIGCFYFTHVLGGTVSRLMPKQNSTAQCATSFVGMVGEITIGTARRGKPAEANFKDEHGQMHLVLVEPLTDSDSFTQEDKIVLIENQDGIWLCQELAEFMKP